MIYYITKQQDTQGLPTLPVERVLDNLNQLKFIGVDTETIKMDPRLGEILSIQVGNFDNQYVFDLSTISIQVLKPILEDPSKILIFQNAKFDLRFLIHSGIFPNRVFDTFLAESVLYLGDPRVKKSLDVLALKYCEATDVDKSIRGKIHSEGLTSRVIVYGATDVKYLELIMLKQLQEAEKKGVTRSIELNNRFVVALSYTEYCGIYMEPSMWQAKIKEDLLNYTNSIEALNNIVREDSLLQKFVDPQLDLFSPIREIMVNWNSSQQVIPVFKALSIPTTIIEEGEEKDSISTKHLKKYKKVHPIVPAYMNYRSAQKLVSSFGDNFIRAIHPVTGRIHTQFKQLVKTGRMSSGGKDKMLKVEFVNLQQIPKDDRHRGCFIARPGNVLISSDYASQESRILADFSQDTKLVDFYLNGGADLHSYTAQLVYDYLKEVPLDVIKEEYAKERQLMKTVNFALAYGAEANTIAENANISLEEATKVYTDYFNTFTELGDYFTKQRYAPFHKGYILINATTGSKLFTPLIAKYKQALGQINNDTFWTTYRYEKGINSKRYQEELKPIVKEVFKMKGNIERLGLNAPIQGTASEMTKLGMVYFMDWILAKKLQNIVLICNLIHDEAVVECPENLAEITKTALKESMEKAGSFFCKTIPIEAEPKISNRWSK